MQVVTSENLVQLHTTGKVDDFKAPDAKTEVAQQVADNAALTSKPRGDDGKFIKQDDSAVTTDKVEKAADAAATDDDEDADLPERVRKQIGKKHRAMKEAEEFGKDSYLKRLAAEERADKAERELQALKNPQKSQATGEPKADDYKTNAEYIEAMVDWRFQQKEQAENQRRNEAAQAKAQAEFIDRLNAARKEIPDYDEVVGEADYEVAPHLASYIAESDLGPKLGYHFAKHPEELERISKLSPIRGIAELGKLETKLEAKPEPKVEKAAEVKVSKAPSPITTIGSDAKAAVTKDPAKMNFQELREYERNKALEQSRR